MRSSSSSKQRLLGMHGKISSIGRLPARIPVLRLARRGLWISTVYFCVLLAPASKALAHDDKGTLIENIDVLDLIVDWTGFRDKTVSIKGAVHCSDEDYCRFNSIGAFHRVVSIDLNMLSSADRRGLIMDCHERDCEIYLTATVNLDDVSAYTLEYR